MKIIFLLYFFAPSIWSSEMVRVEGGTYKALMGKGKSVAVPPFLIDETAVTNNDYRAFVQKNKNWRKSSVKTLFADSSYLRHWKNQEGVADRSLDRSPVVNVSWFAANAYCEWKNKRLPTVNEWEYLAQFGPVNSNTEVKSVILEWYSKPTPKKLPHVKSTFKNKFGVWDVHGLIWEWNEDFNTTFVTGESRGDSALEKSMFCGSGAANSATPEDYAAFMRFGYRSSLKGNYTVENLGFRCAKEVNP